MSNWLDFRFSKSSAQVLVSLQSKTHEADRHEHILLPTFADFLERNFGFIWGILFTKPNQLFEIEKKKKILLVSFQFLVDYASLCVFWGKYNQFSFDIVLFRQKCTKEIKTIHSKLLQKGTIGLINIKFPASVFSKKINNKMKSFCDWSRQLKDNHLYTP